MRIDHVKSRAGERDGMALVIVLLALLAVLGAVMLVTLHVQTAYTMTNRSLQTTLLDEGCKAGVDLAIREIWSEYMENNGNTTGNWASFRFFLDNTLRVETNEDLNGNGQQDNDEDDLNANNQFDMPSESQGVLDLSEFIDTGEGTVEAWPYTFGGGETAGQSSMQVTLSALEVTRLDDLTGTTLTITAEAQAVDAAGQPTQTKRMQQTVRVSGAPFSGFEYAVLANNINCIMCHAEFLALDLERNQGDPNTYGSFDRIKVACLESLLVRTNEADSFMAGTLYTRGDVTNQSGSVLSASQVASISSQFGSFEFDTSNGKLHQNGSGDMVGPVPLQEAALNADGDLEQFANFYRNYPTDPDAMTDGDLPTEFPAPYGDDNENRYVDDDEFSNIVNHAAGTEAAITGGIAYGVPEGSAYSGSALPASSNSAMTDLSTSGSYDGNLILVGTEDNPITIDGSVAVNGDLVISGKVKGWGQLMVRGNTYVVGDVTYADAPGEFGLAADGTENGLALVSGGSILMGDYLTVRGKNDPDESTNTKYPNSRYSIRCREEHRTSTMSDGDVLQYGYFDPGAIDAGEYNPTMIDDDGNEIERDGQQFSFTTSELMLFNNMELEKALADPSYKPRFYGLRETQPTNIYVYDSNDEHSVRYDERGVGNRVKLLSDYLVEEGHDLDLLTDAAFHYMNPDSSWIGEETLRQIWWNDEMTRPSSERRFQFDGLLYSNNAIFGIVRSNVRHGSFTGGRMTIRGAMICPDLGILAAGSAGRGNDSFRLFYDRRVRRFYNLEDTSQVVLRRMTTMPVPVESEHS